MNENILWHLSARIFNKSDVSLGYFVRRDDAVAVMWELQYDALLSEHGECFYGFYIEPLPISSS